jgi:hypothetical protein
MAQFGGVLLILVWFTKKNMFIFFVENGFLYYIHSIVTDILQKCPPPFISEQGVFDVALLILVLPVMSTLPIQ